MTKKVATLLGQEQIQAIREAVVAAIEPILENTYFLVEAVLEQEHGRWYLRLYLERTDGQRISLDECALLSDRFDKPLENCPGLNDLSYTLEVSSPGLFRTLKTPREFRFYQGRPVAIECQGKKVEGILQRYDEADQVLYVQPNAAAPLAGEEALVSLPVLHDGMTITLNPHVPFLEEHSESSEEQKETPHHDD